MNETVSPTSTDHFPYAAAPPPPHPPFAGAYAPADPHVPRSAADRTRQVQRLLLGVGGLLLVLAAAVFVAVTWRHLGPQGQGGLLAAGSAVAVAVTAVCWRRGLPETAEAVAAVACALAVLDVYAVGRVTGAAIDTLTFWSVGTAALAAVFATVALRVPLRAVAGAAVLAAHVSVAFAAVLAGHLVTAAALATAVAFADTLLARRAPAGRLQRLLRVTAGAGCWLAGSAAALLLAPYAVLTTAPQADALAAAVVLTGLAATVHAAGRTTDVDVVTTGIAAALTCSALVAAVLPQLDGAPAPAVAAVWAAAAVVALLGAAGFRDRDHAVAATIVPAGVAAVAGLFALADVLTLLTGLVAHEAYLTVPHDIAVSATLEAGPGVAPWWSLLGVTSAAAAVATAAVRLRSPGTATACALVTVVAAAVVVPVEAGLRLDATAGLYAAIALAATVALTLPSLRARRAPIAALVVASGTLAVLVGLADAALAATVLATLAAGAAVLAVRRPVDAWDGAQSATAAGVAVVFGSAASALAAFAAGGSDAAVAAALVAVPVLAAVVVAVTGRGTATSDVRTVTVEATAGVMGALGVVQSLLLADPVWCSGVLAALGVAALAQTLRPDRAEAALPVGSACSRSRRGCGSGRPTSPGSRPTACRSRRRCWSSECCSAAGRAPAP